MLRTVHLHGALGAEFGRVWALAVETPAEAVRALCTMVPKMRERIEAGSYRLFRGAVGQASALGEDDLRLSLAPAAGAIHIVPTAIGAGGNGRNIGKIVAGALLVAVSFAVPPAGALGFGVITGGLVFGLGASVLLAGVSGMMAKQSRSPSRVEVENEESNLFSSGANVTTPGAAIPVVMGTFEVGSVVASSAIRVEDRVVLEE